jgi:hypothetical protein
MQAHPRRRDIAFGQQGVQSHEQVQIELVEAHADVSI